MVVVGAGGGGVPSFWACHSLSWVADGAANMVGFGEEAIHAAADDEPFRVMAYPAASVVVTAIATVAAATAVVLAAVERVAVVVVSDDVALVECGKQGAPWQQPRLAQPCRQSQDCQVVLMTVVVFLGFEKVAMWVACLLHDSVGAVDGPS